ncbi:hypothetical protein [Streptomyces avermitilis]|uniref:hypothetical protein n=1 Tax=Streptomyces avermitilis TaxID=33903 RepID=UPI0033F42504
MDAATLLMVPAGAPPGQPVGGLLREDRLDDGHDQDEDEDEAGEGQGGQPPRGADQDRDDAADASGTGQGEDQGGQGACVSRA